MMTACEAMAFLKQLRNAQPERLGDARPAVAELLAQDQFVLLGGPVLDLSPPAWTPKPKAPEPVLSADTVAIIKAIKATADPAKARGLTETKVVTYTFTSGGAELALPADPNRRAFAIPTNGQAFTIGLSSDNLNFGGGYNLDPTARPYIFTDQDWGAFITWAWWINPNLIGTTMEFWIESYLQ